MNNPITVSPLENGSWTAELRERAFGTANRALQAARHQHPDAAVAVLSTWRMGRRYPAIYIFTGSQCLTQHGVLDGFPTVTVPGAHPLALTDHRGQFRTVSFDQPVTTGLAP